MSGRVWTRADLELFEFAPDAILVIDDRGHIIFANAATEGVFGYSPSDLHGQPIEVLVPEGSRPRHRQDRVNYVDNPHPRSMSAGLNLSGRRKDGREVPVDISLSPLKTDRGRVVIAAVRDISARRRMELELREAHDKLEADFDLAARIQQSLLPGTQPVVPGLRIAWRFEPCERLAGDSFNVAALDQQRVGVYLLDVCGHGVPAALQAVALTHLLASAPWFQSAGEDRSPAAIAEYLSREFPMDLETWRYFTFFCAAVDLGSRRMRYVTAGHPGPVRVASGSAERLVAGGFPIGLFPQTEYDEYVTELAPGDRIVLHSDGVTEAMSPAEEPYGDHRLLEVLGRGNTQPLDVSLDQVVSDVRKWREGEGFDDDLSIIAFEA